MAKDTRDSGSEFKPRLLFAGAGIVVGICIQMVTSNIFFRGAFKAGGPDAVDLVTYGGDAISFNTLMRRVRSDDKRYSERSRNLCDQWAGNVSHILGDSGGAMAYLALAAVDFEDKDRAFFYRLAGGELFKDGNYSLALSCYEQGAELDEWQSSEREIAACKENMGGW